jgi:O-antigen/teichoic acid export membrane protein
MSALPIGILGLVVTTYARLSTIILAKLGGEVSVAYWTSAHRIAEAVLLATGAFATSMLPVFSRSVYEKASLDSAHKLFFPYLRKMIVLVTGAAIVLALFAEQIISLLFTPAYAEAAPALAVLGYWIISASANMFLTNMLYAAERQRVVLSISSFCLFLNVVLCFFLIPKWGFLGAAVAAAATEFVNTGLQATAVIRSRRFIRCGREFWMLAGRLGIWVIGLGVAIVLLRQGVHPGLSVAITIAYALHLFVFQDFMLKDLSAIVQPILGRGRFEGKRKDEYD